MVALSIETFRSRFFGISREPQTPRSDVTRALPSGLSFEVHVGMSRPCSRGKGFTAGFSPPGGGGVLDISLGGEVQRGPSYPDPV